MSSGGIQEDLLEQMLVLIQQNPGIRPLELNHLLGLEHSATLRDKLIQRGLAKKQKEGQAVKYYPADSIKRLFIIHAWDESPTSCWYPWLKKELEARGFEVQVPAMPNPAAPEMEAWISTLQSLVGKPDQDTYFVGHSIGCQTILRYLSRLSDDQQIGGAIFIAPWTHLTNLSGDSVQIAKPWLETPIDWQAAKERCRKFFAFFSDNDEWVPLSEKKVFQEKLGARTQVISGVGHFDEITDFPELLERMLKMIGIENE